MSSTHSEAPSPFSPETEAMLAPLSAEERRTLDEGLKVLERLFGKD